MRVKPEQVLMDNSFVKRGSAYFRVHGDGILQVIKYEKQGERRSVNLGLFSMYSELLPQWFTSSGCIPRYPVDELADQPCHHFPSQTELLINRGLPWLETINSHSNMLEGLFLLETKRGGDVLWIDELKIAPFLMCRDYASAEKVISAILENHEIARKMNKVLYTNAVNYQRYVDHRIEADAGFIALLDIVHQRNEQKICDYLTGNYVRNTRLAKFCSRKD